MRFISFRLDGREAPGLQLEGGEVVDLSPVAASLIELIEGGEKSLEAARRQAERGERIAADRIELLAPIPRPRKNVFCVGRNYLDHIIEGAKVRGENVPALGSDVPKYPTFFTKAPTTVNRPVPPARRCSPRCTARS